MDLAWLDKDDNPAMSEWGRGERKLRSLLVRSELAGRGLVQANGSSNEGRESLLIDFIVLVEVDCAPGVSLEA
jgi:hypothetical protein